MAQKKTNHKLIWSIIIVGFILIFGVILFTSDAFKPKAAVIPLSGTISFDSAEASPNYLESQIDIATNDPSVEAIVFRINSGGGSVVASKEMAKMVSDIEKPTICWMGDVAASGAYWIATQCDTIVADELTLTGSIGVTAAYLEFSGLMEEYGIGYNRITSGKFKDIGTPFRNLTKEEEKILEKSIDVVFDAFVTTVVENRGVTEKSVRDMEGNIVLGLEAKELGLVDVLGGRDVVLELVQEKTENKEIELEFYQGAGSLQELLQYIPAGNIDTSMLGPIAFLLL